MASDDLALEEFSTQSDLPSSDDAGDKTAADLATVFDVPVNISAVLGKSHMSVSQLLKLNKGSVLELDRKVGEAIDIFVNNRLIGALDMIDLGAVRHGHLDRRSQLAAQSAYHQKTHRSSPLISKNRSPPFRCAMPARHRFRRPSPRS